ncbi:CHAT domain-containing protein [Longispora sp. K20-0274]|uniref:CHAT domain-containing protein n=1 Tax=Longispora sp. K20-0274 TaxID=3088255 RepID=UPI003999B398
MAAWVERGDAQAVLGDDAEELAQQVIAEINVAQGAVWTDVLDILEAYRRGRWKAHRGAPGGLVDLANYVDLLDWLTPDAETVSDDAGPVELLRYRAYLAMALVARYELTQDREDLERSIVVARRVVAASDGGGPELRMVALVSLANALQTRYDVHRLGDDMEECVRIRRLTVDLAGRDRFEEWSVADCNLASSLLKRGRSEDVSEAARLLEVALHATPERHPERHSRVVNLVVARRAQVVAAGMAGIDQLRAAIGFMHPFAAEVGPKHRGGVLNNLAQMYTDLYARSGQPEDLDEAVLWHRESARAVAMPAGSRHWYMLGKALEIRWRKRGQHKDAVEAIDAFRQASSNTADLVSRQVESGQLWGELSAEIEDWPAAVEGYETAVSRLPQMAARFVPPAQRRQLLASLPGLAGDACGAALNAGFPDRALAVLEAARGVLWAQRAETRCGTELPVDIPGELAARFAKTRELLNQSAWDEELTTRVDERMVLTNEWNDVVAAIRAVPGLEQFLSAPTAASLLEVMGERTVVVVNASAWRCDALIIREGRVEVLRLPSVTGAEAVVWTNRYLAALNEDSDDMEETIASTLAWLWDVIAEPVLNALGIDRPHDADSSDWTRIWWCPTGPLTMLPLHAAGRHCNAGLAAGASVLDRVVSSHTATLAALSSTDTSAGRSEGRALIVGMPVTPEQEDLAEVEAEIAFVSALLDPSRLTVLATDQATVDEVGKAFGAHQFVHYAGHAGQDLMGMTAGGLCLHDGTLSPAHLGALGRPAGQFAFLSACQTAAGVPHLADEVITFAAALQFLGWPNVIATLWYVGDTVSFEIAQAVYTQIAEAGTIAPAGSALALHRAVRAARAKYRQWPSQWAFHIHVGG